MKSLRFVVALAIGAAAFAQAPVPDAKVQRVLQHLGQAPLTLEPNRGQAPRNVDFVASSLSHKILLSATGPRLEIFDAATKSVEPVELQLLGANPSATGQGLDKTAFTSAYFFASDKEGRLRNLPNYSKVLYRQVWPGIDALYYGNREKLEYDLIVAPGADPDAIKIKLLAHNRFSLTPAGDLLVQTRNGSVTQHKPLAYQMADNQRQEVAATYEFTGAGEVRIRLGKYDPARELVIDPTLTLSSPTVSAPLGAVAIDPSSNIYVGAFNGTGVIGVLKCDPSGNPVRLGNFSADTIGGMAVSAVGTVYVTGSTSALTFPNSSAFQPNLRDPEGTATDAFVLAYMPDPQLVPYASYFGGIGNDVGKALALNSNTGFVYITGSTVGGSQFPTTLGPAFAGGDTDAFVAVFDTTQSGAQSLIYSRYIGGNGADSGNGIAVDSAGNVYIGGATTSTSASFQPASATGYNPSKTTATNDGFIVKLNSTVASGLYLTFLPLAPVNGLAIDANSAAYVTGAVDGTTAALATTPSGFQITNGGNGCAAAPFFVQVCTDAFLSKYDTTQNGAGSLLYSTYLGGNLSDAGFGVAVDSTKSAYVVGRTNSSNFPIARPLAGFATYQGGAIVDTNSLNNQFDGFIAKINTLDSGAPSLVYSTYLGGSDTDQVNSVAVDNAGNAYIAGQSASQNFPNTTVASTATGLFGFFARINDSATTIPVLSITKTHTGNFAQGQVGKTYTVTVSNVGSGPTVGQVTVTETAPAGLTVTAMSGTGWVCNTVTCTRSDVLAAHTAYPAITVTVNVLANATSPQVNQATVSGGGAPTASVSDSTIVQGGPALSITKTHSGNFTQGQTGATYTVTVSNGANSGATNGTVTVTETAPAGLTVTSMAGTGWVCNSVTCTRGDALAGGASYPAITVTVNVAGNAGSPVVNQVSASGGGSATANASDSTVVLSGSQASLKIVKTHTGNFTQGQQGATYALTVSNNAGAAATSGTMTVTDTLPSGLTLVSMAGTGWSCAANVCTRSDALAGGASYPVITVTVNVSATATSPRVNQVSVSGGGSATANASDSTIVNLIQATLSVNRKVLNYGISGGLITSPQTVLVTITGGVNVAWTATSDRNNITVNPGSGVGTGTFQISASIGSSGIVTVTAPGALNSPQTITVNVALVTPTLPFGSFDTPVNNTSGVVGAIPVTGWALDLLEVTHVDIFREPIVGEPAGTLVFIGTAVFSADARPDVAAMFPAYPYQYRAGWGYQMLTNFLPNASGSGAPGNGTYRLHAIAFGKSGSQQDLGTKTITVDNAHAAKPFGTIDTPSQGGTISGSDSVNFGWALTPQPGIIPINGSTITVVIDGVPVGNPTYNQFRSDIANLFPGYANSMGAVGFFHINTTTLANGVHTISWNVFDNLNRGEGLGSRYFNVLNTGGGGSVAAEDVIDESVAKEGVRVLHGLDVNRRPDPIAADADGGYSVTMEEVGRIELHLGAAGGNMVVEGDAQALPIGSTLKGGVFYWQPGPGFLGEYTLQFERRDGTRIPVRVNIVPKQWGDSQLKH
ncbi:MAG TPA: SBBP repeat-containing protein [Bryobacteraceae bacterium]